MSISGGFEKSIDRAELIGCTCIQIFTKSNRQWYAKNLNKEEIALFKKKLDASTIIKVVAHASYLINIGSPDKNTNQQSIDALSLELQRCQALGIPSLIIHPGAYLGSSLEACLELIAENLNTILDKNQGETSILLENTAGQGTTVGYTFEQLATIYGHIKQKKRIGFCFDTCHAFVAGYDFRTKKTYTNLWSHVDEIIGIKNIKAIHMNDSKKNLGSKVDRHEHIGKGQLGLEAFQLLLNDENLFDIPKILETPKDDSLSGYANNMETLRKLLIPKTQSILS